MARFDDLEDSVVEYIADGHNLNRSESVELINNMTNMEMLEIISWILKEKGILPFPIKE